MKRLLKDPLTHFTVLGALVFALYPLAGHEAGAGDNGDTIVVDEASLLRFIQFRSRAFNAEHFENVLASMSEEELQFLIDDYVREEVLFREATKMGLERDDYIIRRRLVQKMEFLSDTSTRTALSDNAVAAYFEANRGRYYVEPHATFTHVFFDADRHGWAEAKRLAQAASAAFAADPPAFDAAVNHGDRFPFHLNYVERVPELVAAHFGENAAAEVFAFEPNAHTWRGPVKSDYGYHLVLLTDRTDGRPAELWEVAERVREDAMTARQNELLAAGLADVIAAYDVRVEYDNGEAQPS